MADETRSLQIPSQDIRDLMAVTIKLAEGLIRLQRSELDLAENAIREVLALQASVVSRWQDGE
jgi:CRP-like cAMP-binding protein